MHLYLFRTELKAPLSSLGLHSGVWQAVWFFFNTLEKGWSNQTFIYNLVIINLLCLYLILHLFEALPQVISQGGLPSQSCCFFERWISTHLVPLSFSQYIFQELSEIYRMVMMGWSPVNTFTTQKWIYVLPFALRSNVVWLERNNNMKSQRIPIGIEDCVALSSLLAGIPTALC